MAHEHYKDTQGAQAPSQDPTLQKVGLPESPGKSTVAEDNSHLTQGFEAGINGEDRFVGDRMKEIAISHAEQKIVPERTTPAPAVAKRFDAFGTINSHFESGSHFQPTKMTRDNLLTDRRYRSPVEEILERLVEMLCRLLGSSKASGSHSSRPPCLKRPRKIR